MGWLDDACYYNLLVDDVESLAKELHKEYNKAVGHHNKWMEEKEKEYIIKYKIEKRDYATENDYDNLVLFLKLNKKVYNFSAIADE